MPNPTTPAVEANAENIPRDQLDCGINALGWCSGFFCQKFATMKAFIIFFSISSAIQGGMEAYFRISAKQAALEYDYDPVIVEWLLVSHGIFEALLGFVVAFWAYRLHPISWMGGLLMLQSAASLMVIIPTIADDAFVENLSEPADSSVLCPSSSGNSAKVLPMHSIATLVLFFILQLAIGMGSAVLYAVGTTYIDQNSDVIDSPALIGTAIGARIWGSQLGTFVSLGVTATSLGWWLGWAILTPFVFTFGILLSLFPQKLSSTIVKQAANRILHDTNPLTRPRSYGYLDDMNFLPSLRRLLLNKILMFNIMSLVFFYAASINYFLQEQSYLQSRFYLPTDERNGLLDEWLSRFLSYMLRPPIAGLGVLVAGLIISKVNPSARSMTSWNISIGVLTLVLYITYIFIDCSSGPIAGSYRDKLIQPYCSRGCICSGVEYFTPVCPENGTQTYFSPCHAGCSKKTSFNNIDIYEQCTCGNDVEQPTLPRKAIEGACNASDCQTMWVIFQILTVIAAGLLATTYIAKIIISLRSVLPQDKSLALALELFLTGIITYVPAKLCYDAVIDKTCQYWTKDYSKCVLQESPLHGNIINGISALLAAIGIIFDVLVFIFVADLDCYPTQEEDAGFGIPLQTTPSSYTRYTEITNEDDDDSSRRNNHQHEPLMPSRRAPAPHSPSINSNSSSNNNPAYTQPARPNTLSLTAPDQLDFRLQPTPITIAMRGRSPQQFDSDSNSQRSESPYLRELRNRQIEYAANRRRPENRDGARTPETDF